MNRLHRAVLGTVAGAAMGVGASLGESMLESPSKSAVEACADQLDDTQQEVAVLPDGCSELNSETNVVFAAEVNQNGTSVYTLPSRQDFLTEQRDGAAATTKGYAILGGVALAFISLLKIENVPSRIIKRLRYLESEKQGLEAITSKNNFLTRKREASYNELLARGVIPSAPSGPIVTNRVYRKIIDSKPVQDLAGAVRNDERTHYAGARFMTSRLVKKFLEITSPTDE